MTTIANQFIKIINDPKGDVQDALARISGHDAQFVLCLGSTQTSDIPGISAAGVTPEMRRVTPATDAEALMLGRAVSVPSIPVSPRGIVSPVVITRACIKLSSTPVTVVDCGAFQSPQCPVYKAGKTHARCLSTGDALDMAQVENLWRLGRVLGEEIARQKRALVLAECVPGGTTTALGVLTALGYAAGGLLSSSLPGCNHEERMALVEAGLERAELSKEEARQKPLRAVAAVGDPMQAFVAGAATAASRNTQVVLAGGSQMLAVYALFQAMQETMAPPQARFQPITVTTKWVALDPFADTAELSRRLGAPYAASCPDFTKSRHAGLKAYEEGNVKEGIGAGGAMMLAHQCPGSSQEQIMSAIDDTYEELCSPGRA